MSTYYFRSNNGAYQELELTLAGKNDDLEITLPDMGLKNGDTVIVQETHGENSEENGDGMISFTVSGITIDPEVSDYFIGTANVEKVIKHT